MNSKRLIGWGALAILALTASVSQAALIASDSFATLVSNGYQLGPIEFQNPTAGSSGFIGEWNNGTAVFQAAVGGLTHDLMTGTARDGQLVPYDSYATACRRLSRALDYTPTDGTYYTSVLLQNTEANTTRDFLVGLGPLEPANYCSSQSQATYIGLVDGGIGFQAAPTLPTQLLTAGEMTVGETYFALLQIDFSTSSLDSVTASVYDGSSSRVAHQVFGGLDLDGDIGRFGLSTYNISPVQIADEWRFGTALEDVMIVNQRTCDFDGDGDCDITDLNAMLSVGPVAPGVPASGNEQYDLDNNGTINNADVDEWLDIAATENGFGSPYLRGDLDLSGGVDGSDFNDWNSHKFTASLMWDRGDVNGDGSVDGSDFGIWNRNKFTSSDRSAAIPEPTISLLSILVIALLRRRTHSQETAGR